MTDDRGRSFFGSVIGPKLDFCRFPGGLSDHPSIPLPPEDAEFAAVRGAEISAHTNLYT
jgi:hypothetical protein